jgi:hypothetical protein
MYLRQTAHSSFCSASRAPAGRTRAARLGKMPTTSVRRRTSLLSRSRGLLDRISFQMALGKSVKAKSSSAASSSIAAALGEAGLELLDDGSQLSADRVGIGLGEDRADEGGDGRLGGLGTRVRGLVMKRVRQRCQAAPGKTDAMAIAAPDLYERAYTEHDAEPAEMVEERLDSLSTDRSTILSLALAQRAAEGLRRATATYGLIAWSGSLLHQLPSRLLTSRHPDTAWPRDSSSKNPCSHSGRDDSLLVSSQMP